MNHDKREPVLTATRHLGFSVDLSKNMLSVTKRHHRKIMAHFNRFLAIIRYQGRIRVREVQKMLGLQIWISTVFTVARQFLTSACDLLRVTGDNRFFYPRLRKQLVARIIFDWKFWRRFVASDPKQSFESILGQLPDNTHILACDACTSWGMAGVVSFGGNLQEYPGLDGLFWQMTWLEWKTVYQTPYLIPGKVIINVAEFLAALITYKTFAKFCSQKTTTLRIDSTVAQAWLDSCRCPRHPFDRCAQAVHFRMLKRSAKFRTSWVPSGDNSLADIFSRGRFSANSNGHVVNGLRFCKVKPSWNNVIKLL